MKYQADYILNGKDKQISYAQSVNLAVESMATKVGGMKFTAEEKKELEERIEYFYGLLVERPFEERVKHGMSHEERKDKVFEARDLSDATGGYTGQDNGHLLYQEKGINDF